MKNYGFLLLAAFAFTNANAGEVGATFPQLANSPALMAVAIADTGVSASLAIQKTPEIATNNHQLPLEQYIESAYQSVMNQIHERVESSVPEYRTIFAQRTSLP